MKATVLLYDHTLNKIHLIQVEAPKKPSEDDLKVLGYVAKDRFERLTGQKQDVSPVGILCVRHRDDIEWLESQK